MVQSPHIRTCWSTGVQDEYRSVYLGCLRPLGVYDEDTDPIIFAWIIVVLQRSIALGVKIADNQPGTWMQQYGVHIAKTGRQRDDGANSQAEGRMVTGDEDDDRSRSLQFNTR